MQCPYCANGDTRVIDSRLGGDGECVRRRRVCQACDGRFSTLEQVVLELPLVIKSDGNREKFDETKLRRGMTRALEKRPIDAEAVEGAIARLKRQFTHRGEPEIPAAAIGEAVMAELSELDEVAFVRFASVYRRFQDIDAFSDEVEKLKESLPSLPSEAQLSLLGSGNDGDGGDARETDPPVGSQA